MKQEQDEAKPTQAGEDAPLHRPEDDIEEMPRLKPKPVGSRTEHEKVRPPTRGGTLFGQPHQDEAPQPEKLPKKIMFPRRIREDARSPYATHRPAPPDEEAEKQEVASITGRRPDREVSAGFLIGIALIVVVLVGGIMIARLGKKVGALEQRISRLESVQGGAAIADRHLP